MGTNLSGKTAVVTGSSKGIGYAIAESLAEAGANVLVSARNAEEVARAARALNARGSGHVVGVVCDVREHDDVRMLISRAVEEFGKLDILVNNAGVGGFAPVAEMSPELWEQVIDTNLTGLFYACHEAIPHLRSAGGGWIINIGSLAGKNAFPGAAAYNASKFGLIGFSEALMQEVRYDGIRVNYIMPGSVNTYFNQKEPDPENEWKLQPSDLAELVMDLLAFKSHALPSRIEVRPSMPPRK
ncbi:MAG TPA: SDR family oxidoreductase [Longimicrobiaceae bacterium]|nr:SDR family oxidoreductase [Longimicrobiaceae bacterium]